MTQTIEAYQHILFDVFGDYLMPDMTEADWIAFSRDMEESLRSLPIWPMRGEQKISLSSILIMRGKGMRLKEIANSIGRSPERVRQLSAKALRLMRHPDRSTRLAKWLVPLDDLDSAEVVERHYWTLLMKGPMRKDGGEEHYRMFDSREEAEGFLDEMVRGKFLRRSLVLPKLRSNAVLNG